MVETNQKGVRSSSPMYNRGWESQGHTWKFQKSGFVGVQYPAVTGKFDRGAKEKRKKASVAFQKTRGRRGTGKKN